MLLAVGELMAGERFVTYLEAAVTIDAKIGGVSGGGEATGERKVHAGCGGETKGPRR